MKKECKIIGLDCPNCAKTLENKINNIKGVENAHIDFLKSTFSFESDNIEKSMKEIIELTKQIEPDVTYIDNKQNNYNKKILKEVGILTLGIILGIVSCFIDKNILIYWILFISSVLLLGYKTYYKAVVLLLKGTINENLLLTISVIGATIINQNTEAFMVIGLYSIGKIFESIALDKSRKSIEKITSIRPDYATVLIDGKEEKVNPELVTIGSKIIVKAGERVPIDGIVLQGKANLDVQSLTGESLPIYIKENETIMSGSIVLDSFLEIETTSEYKDSTISRIMHLIQEASEKKSKTETMISKITRWYTLGVIILSIIVFISVLLITNQLNTAIYRGLIFLVISCPCAFAISVPLSYFSGIGNASKNGVLIKGSNYLDICSKLDLIAFDKTGTLTSGKFIVEKVKVCKESINENEIIYLASLGEQYSLHPLAKSILNYNHKKLETINEYKEISGEGVYFKYKNSNYFVGRKNREIKDTIVELYNEEEKLGEIVLKDEIKHTSSKTIKKLKDMKIKTLLISGDNQNIVNQIVDKLEIDEGYYNLLPQEKYNLLDKIKKEKEHTIAYVGDGINDAPSLMLADVGIAMGINGSPSSIEAADIVLVDDNPYKIISAIKISKYTQKIVWENIILSATIKFLFLLLGTLGITGMLSAVFADVGVTLLAILNSTRALIYDPNK